MKKLILPLIICFILFGSKTVYSGINLKNGNFFISYTDYKYCIDNIGCFEIVRTYNSKAVNVGLFGFGWGSALETNLKFFPDETIQLNNWGSGSRELFYISNTSSLSNINAVNILLTAALENNQVKTDPVSIMSWKNDILSNTEKRNRIYNQYLNNNWIEKTTPALGIYESHSGLKNITVNNDKTSVWKSFDVNFCDGIKQQFETKTFNDDGKLINEYRKNEETTEELGFNFTILYNDDKLPSHIYFFDDTITLEYKNKTLSKISGKMGVAEYRFDNKNNLIYSKDIASNIYEYEYDAVHNMTAIKYTDNSRLQVKYDQVRYFAIEIINRGDTTSSKYEYDYIKFPDGSINYNNFFRSVTYFSPTDTFTNYYEYETRNNGLYDYSYKILTNERDIVSETIYTEFQTPFKITKNGLITVFEYDRRKNLIKKEGFSNSFYANYNQSDQMTKLYIVSQSTSDTTEFLYEYNEAKQLIKVWENNTLFEIEYNKSGFVESVKSEEKKLSFKYDTNYILNPVFVSFHDGNELTLKYDSEDKVIEKKSNLNDENETVQLFETFQKYWLNTSQRFINYKAE